MAKDMRVYLFDAAHQEIKTKKENKVWKTTKQNDMRSTCTRNVSIYGVTIIRLRQLIMIYTTSHRHHEIDFCLIASKFATTKIGL